MPGPGKAGENILGILGTALDVGGKLLLGPGADVDLGAPFKLGAQLQRQKREEKALMEVLSGNPATAPLVDLGNQVMGQGGVIPMMSGGSNGILPGESGGMPTQQPQGQPVDIHSPDFARKLAEYGLGDLSQKVLFAQTQGRPADPMEQVLTALGIQQKIRESQDYIPPREKMALENQYKTEFANNQNNLIMDRIQATNEERKSYPTPKQQETLQENRNIADRYTSLSQRLTQPDFVKGMFTRNLLGRQALNKSSPEFIAFSKEADDIRNQLIQSQGGKALTGTELNLYTPVLPATTEDPEVFKQGVERQISKFRYMDYINSMTMVDAGVDPEKIGIAPQDIQLFKAMREMWKRDPKKASQDPRVIQGLQKLNLDPGVWFPNLKGQ